MANELKPYIDEHYRTNADAEQTAIGGASMGAYISLYTSIKYPDKFGKVLGLSPVFGFNKAPYVDFIRNTKADKVKAVYLDSGDKEEEMFPGAVADVREMAHLLESDGGIKSEHIKTVIDPDGDHSKNSWQRRFPEAFLWLMAQ